MDMFFSIGSLLALVGVLAISFLIREQKKNDSDISVSKLSLLIFGLLALFLGAPSFLVKVDEGHRGVVKTFGKASDAALDPGLHFRLPSPIQEIVPVSVMAEVYSETYDCSSKDLQQVRVEMTVVYERLANDVVQTYRRVKLNSEATDVRPGALEVLKAMTAEYDASNIIQQRAELSQRVEDGIEAWISQYGLRLVECSISDVDFSTTYDNAIERKQVALEDALKAENELKEERTRAEIREAREHGEAQAQIERARGEADSARQLADAEAYRIRVEAEAEAEKILAVATAEAESIRKVGEAEAARVTFLEEALRDNPSVVHLLSIEQWSGQLPNFWFGGNDQGGAFPLGMFMNLEGEQALTVSTAESSGS